MPVAYNKLFKLGEKKTIEKIGINTNLKMVSKFGIFIIIPSNNNLIHNM